MRKMLLALSMVLLTICAEAATVYISDALTVPLRRGHTTGHKIIHAGLPSGGGVPTLNLSHPPLASDRLAAAQRRVQTLEAELKSLRANLQEARGTRTEVERNNSQLNKQTEQLQAELAEIRRVSATSIAHYEENKQLKALTQDLQTQNTQLTERVRQLERNIMLRWFLAGGGLVLVGLLLGAWIKSRPKRSTWA